MGLRRDGRDEPLDDLIAGALGWSLDPPRATILDKITAFRR
jgi:hypothetical protein